MSEALDALNKVYPFRLLPDEQKDRLAQHAALIDLPGEKVIYSEGDPAAMLYLILNGEVELSRGEVDDEDTCEPLGVLQAGDLFGLEMFDERGDYRTNAITLGSVRLLTLQEDDLFTAVQDTPLLYAPLRQMMRGFMLGQRVRLPWREPDEAVIYMARRHPVFLWVRLLPPLFIFLVSTLVLIYLIAADLPGTILLGIGMGVAALLGGLWAIWNGVDWSNDFSIITSRRVAWQERVVMLYDSRQEAPLQTVLANTTDTSQMGRILGYGNVVLKTFTGTIILPNISQPAIVSLLLQERRGLMQVWQRHEDLKQIKQMVRNRINPPPPPAPEPAAPPASEAEDELEDEEQPSRTAERIANLLRMRAEENGIITYRQHWLVLLRQIFFPLVLIIGLFVLVVLGAFRVVTLLSVGALAALGLGVGLILLFWLWYQYEDWANDKYILTDEQLIDVYKKPLGEEEKRTAPLKNIQSVEYERLGIISLILNFGTVFIRIGDTQFTFDNVYNPSDVQREITRRMEALANREKQKEQTAVREGVLDMIQAYDEIKKEQNGQPGGGETSPTN